MGNGKPQISILMAVYEPRLDWLREQLRSLNKQTYPNLCLYIRDDCSPTVSFQEIQSCVAECVQAFPYEIRRNEKNLGSNLTFQRLTEEAEGAYFSYCDQDDIWMPEKLTVLQTELEKTSALLICSDMNIIDGSGRQTADSITKVRRRHTFHSGEGLAESLLISNFVTGCTMLVRAEQAKAAVPFCPYMIHDHYLALWCAEQGKIISLPRQLIFYRIHGNNQSSMLAGVTDKKSYGRVRIDLVYNRLSWLEKYFPSGAATARAIQAGLQWAAARQKNWSHQGGKGKVWKYRRFSKTASLFELIAVWLPNWCFMWFVALIRRNRL